MPKKETVKPIPEGFHSVTPHFVVSDSRQAIEFYAKVFGAQTRDVLEMPQGKIGHVEMQIGDSIIMFADEFPEMGAVSPLSLHGTAVTLHLYVTDADAVFKKAVEAGAKPTMPMTDAFWGDRYGQVIDPFGHKWSIATHKENLTKEEMARRMKAWAPSQP